jgi:hypothetical protein
VQRKNGTIQAQDRPLAETTTVLPPMLLFVPVTRARLERIVIGNGDAVRHHVIRADGVE